MRWTEPSAPRCPAQTLRARGGPRHPSLFCALPAKPGGIAPRRATHAAPWAAGLGADCPRRRARHAPSGNACSAGGWKPVLGGAPPPAPAQGGPAAPRGARRMASRRRTGNLSLGVGEQGDRACAGSRALDWEWGLGKALPRLSLFLPGSWSLLLPHFPLLPCARQLCWVFLAGAAD